jgi:AmmeMemoRadiSam system protein B
MKMHGCKTLFIIPAAVLCLFLVSGAISGNMPSAAGTAGKMAGPLVKARDPGSPYNAEGGGTSEFAQALEAGVAEDTAGTSVAAAAGESAKAEGTDVNTGSGKSAAKALSCRYFNERDFMKSVNQAAIPGDETGDAADAAKKGGIVPHHLLAGRMIANFFVSLAQDPPGTIILIGPNHKLAGTNEIQTSCADWITAFGTLEADDEIVRELTERLGASENEGLMEIEHSISSLVPYIKYYMPDTKIVPVLLHGSYTQQKAKELGALLAEIAAGKSDIFILASIDFSHYLDIAEADRMDEMTLDAISSWDLDKLGMMTNDNLDSVPSAVTLLTAMDIMGAKDIDVTGHGNSSRITYSSFEYTTGYYTIFFSLSDHGHNYPCFSNIF